MSTTIRLTRMGRKKRPFYRLIVTDSRNRRDGAFIANLGYYNPFVEPLEVKLHEEEIVAWLKKGATTSDTARALMKREGVLLRWELTRQGMDKAEIDAKITTWKADSAGREQLRLKTKADKERKAVAEAEQKAKEEAEAAAKEEEAKKAAEAAEAEAAAAEEAGEEAAEDVAEDTADAGDEG